MAIFVDYNFFRFLKKFLHSSNNSGKPCQAHENPYFQADSVYYVLMKSNVRVHTCKNVHVFCNDITHLASLAYIFLGLARLHAVSALWCHARVVVVEDPPPLLADPPPKVAHDNVGSHMESCLSRCGGPPPSGWLAPLASWPPPRAGFPPPRHVVYGWGARALRWLSVLISSCPYK